MYQEMKYANFNSFIRSLERQIMYIAKFINIATCSIELMLLRMERVSKITSLYKRLLKYLK